MRIPAQSIGFATRAALALVVLSLGTGCGDVAAIDMTGGSGGDTVPTEVVDAFAGSCAFAGCHDAGTRAGGLSLAAADLGSIIGAPSSGSALPLVVLGDVQGSYLAVKMLPDDILATYGLERVGTRMPQTADFTNPNNATILAWIAGAEFEGGSTSSGTDTDTTTDGTSTGDGMPTFDADIWPILMPKCSCHLSAPNEPLNGGFSFPMATAYDDLVGVPSDPVPSMNYVTAGDPAQSYLLHKMKGTHLDVGGDGGLMPLGAAMPIAEVATIETWIVNGAPK